MDKEVLGVVLKSSWKDFSVKAVLNVDSVPAVPKNYNFLSTVTRLTLKVVLGNGRLSTKSLIFKDAHVNEGVTEKWQEEYSVFQLETMMYMSVLKEMEHLMEEFEDSEGVLWCKLIHYIPYSCILLEDLKASGFTMKLKNELFDLETALMVVDALGRFHAMSKVLEERGTLSKEDYKKWFIADNDQMHKFLFWNMSAAVGGIKKYWSSKWASIVDKFLKLNEEALHNKMKKMGEFDERKFYVLNHGDLNKHNMMFKYDWRNRPIEIRFLDYQLPHYGSPCCDLTFMLYQCTDPHIRRDNFGLILQTYHDSLVRNLDKFNFSGAKPDLQEINGMMEYYSFYGLYLFFCYYPLMISPKDMTEYCDFGKIAATQGKEGYNLEYLNNECLEQDMGPDIEVLAKLF